MRGYEIMSGLSDICKHISYSIQWTFARFCSCIKIHMKYHPRVINVRKTKKVKKLCLMRGLGGGGGMGENLKISFFFRILPKISKTFLGPPRPPSYNKIFSPVQRLFEAMQWEREISKDDFINTWTLSCRQININA